MNNKNYIIGNNIYKITTYGVTHYNMRKPKLIISKCLNSEKCRYNGQGFDDKVVSILKDQIDIETVCPETAIGLSTPRDPIRIEKHDNEYKLTQRNSNFDYTCHMNEFAEDFLSKIEDVDGFILKSKSPSCGIKDVKIYTKGNNCSISKNGSGIFSKKVINSYSNIPVEDEGRLKNYTIRDEFLTKIFTINNLKSSNNIIDFHNKNLLLLTSYSQDMVNELNNIINKEKINDIDINLYKNKVHEILCNKRTKRSKLNIIKTIFEKYKNKLGQREIENYGHLLKLYKNQKIPFSALLVAIKIYAIRFNDEELLSQTFFNPYPESLISISDSGKGRDL